MTETNKNLNWRSKLSIEDAKIILSEYSKKCQNKGISINKELKLFHTYSFDTYWMTNNYIEISNYFKFSKKDTPDINLARETLLKLISVCLSSHIYLRPNSKIKYEPYVFSIPNLNNFGMFSYGIIYTIEDENDKCSTIVVAEWDIQKSFNNLNIAPWNKINILQDDNLFDIDKIKKIKEMDNKGYLSISDWKSFNLYKEKVNKIEDISEFSFGKILNFDVDLKEHYSQVGCVWSQGVKKWYIPKGLDFKIIEQYLTDKKGATKK